MRIKRFPHYLQLDAMDCGPTCLRMIARYYGKSYSLKTLRARSFITRNGVSMLGISDAAESVGFRTTGLRLTLKQLAEEMTLPCILHWNQNHFVVCYYIRKTKHGWRFYVADPATQLVTYTETEVRKCWLATKRDGEETGMVLGLVPTPDFYENEDEKKGNKEKGGGGLAFFFKYLLPYKSQMVQIVLGMILISLLQLIFPFLTQALVDVGIRDADLGFITLILIAQLVVSVSQLSVDFIRSWILLHVNTRINISLISDFLIKLMKLPIRFFDTKMIGDIMQRIGDHSRIESFLTGTSVNTLFSFVNFFVFSIILAWYSPTVLFIFIIGNTLYIGWILMFMKYRRALDMKRFAQASNEQSSMIQMVSAMQEIKLDNCEKQKRWQWERIQVRLFKIRVKGLALGQMQSLGSVFFNQVTNIIISFIAAKSVVEGNMTLGMMMSVTYIIGQLNGPVGSFIGFVQQLQDARISLERLNEIHCKEDEEENIEAKLTTLPVRHDIKFDHVSFSYSGAERDNVLDDINLTISEKRVTAIVGSSGSGKTTLVKLMLAFYEPGRGMVKIGNSPLYNINPHLWRESCGAVMQDSFIFSDTIANNIAVGEDEIDLKKLEYAVHVANIRDFIDSLPLGFNTRIGMEGNGISQGQRQRLLIARAVYKNPEFLFFDEATNALDTKNERIIIERLQEFYHDKTVVIVAHRLSTVCNADNIVVIDNGRIAEQGNHEDLVAQHGLYYQLVKNQLELGS